jgi:sec-independent protein translocase protein TatA
VIVTLLILNNIGLPGLIVIGLVVLLLFGNRLPNVMRNLGRGVTNFKQGLKEGADEDEDSDGGGKAKKD